MKKEQLDSLTGLRFIAAFAIVWLHSNLYFKWADIGQGLPLVLGVSFFFVLSGFILSHAYGSRSISYFSFLKGRIARLWPLHVACILSVLLWVQPDSQSFDGPGIFGKWSSLVVNLSLLQSWVPTTSYMFSWNSVSWSISTEMFFYAMFPLLLRRSTFFVLVIGALPLVVLATLIPAFHVPASGGVFDVTQTALLYSFPPARLMEFCIGIASYRAWSRIRTYMPTTFVSCTVAELAALGVFALWMFGNSYAGFVFGWSSALSGWYSSAGACVAFAIIIVTMAASRGLIGTVVSSPIMVKLGEVSFAIYMTHQIVMKVISLTHPTLGAHPLFVLSAVFVAGAAGHFLIEKPCQRLIMGGLRLPAIFTPVAVK